MKYLTSETQDIVPCGCTFNNASETHAQTFRGRSGPHGTAGPCSDFCGSIRSCRQTRSTGWLIPGWTAKMLLPLRHTLGSQICCDIPAGLSIALGNSSAIGRPATRPLTLHSGAGVSTQNLSNLTTSQCGTCSPRSRRPDFGGSGSTISATPSAHCLIQDGASLAYVKEQMGHSSIQITVDTYGHLVPGADISWVDRLDAKSEPQQSATQAQPEAPAEGDEDMEVVENIWLPPRDSNPDMLIQSQLSCR